MPCGIGAISSTTMGCNFLYDHGCARPASALHEGARRSIFLSSCIVDIWCKNRRPKYWAHRKRGSTMDVFDRAVIRCYRIVYYPTSCSRAFDSRARGCFMGAMGTIS